MMPQSMQDEPPAPAPTAEGGFILVVEDDADYHPLYTHYLEEAGHEVCFATSGAAALAQMRGALFDLVLLDLRLPDIDGLEVLRAMRADPALAPVPAIVVTADADIDQAARGIAMGAEDVMLKPIRPAILGARVRGAIERKRARERQAEYLEQIARERARAEDLLRILLPEPVAGELKATGRVVPRRFPEVGVLFADVAGFTRYAESRDPAEIHAELQTMVCRFEDLAAQHGLLKIKVIGDCFMATAGLLVPAPAPVDQCIACGRGFIAAVHAMGNGWDLRVGIDIGPVVGGILGRRHYRYDVWGDTVNTAARVQDHGAAGKVNLSTRARDVLAGRCPTRLLGVFSADGKPDLAIHIVDE